MSSLIKELAILNGVKTVVIGKVQESKNKENDLPDLVNQLFKLLPHGKWSEEYFKEVQKELTGLKGVVRIRIYKLSEGISESLLYAGIGVGGSVNLPGGIRAGITCQTPSEAPSVKAE